MTFEGSFGDAVLRALPGGWSLSFEERPLDAKTIAAARDAVAEHGGGRLTMWCTGPTPEGDAIAADAGFTSHRDLYQLRCPLPLGIEDSEPVPLPVRAFVPGRDEAAWLEVNNRAFSWHPEQGGWDASVIAAREKEPWFDPAGFLLYEEGETLAGFCWTKIHRDHEPALGEIYVIGVDPAFAGHGLGRRLSIAGLRHLADRDVTIGMLYVDESNESARRMYDRLGFRWHSTDRGYTTVVPVTPSR